MTSSTLTAHFIFTMVSVAFFCVMQGHAHAETCAESCSCNAEDTDLGSAVNVQCGDRNLMSVPVTKHDKPVSLLNASFNVLMTLEEDALLSYESVRYLYLQYCKIDNINEKAFQRLENLTKLDLSSNRLTSVPPNLFNGNQKLDMLILRRNDLGTLQWNTPILNGSLSLSFLDLQSCQLSNVSSITFSLLHNLTFLDISRNKLVLLNNDSLSSHKNLKDVNLENNPWECGAVFHGLLCWMHTNLVLSYNRRVTCQYRNGTQEIWSPQNRSSLCNSESTQSVTTPHKPGISTSTKLNLAFTPSHELDISKSTTLNLASILSYKPGISTSTKLNLTSNSSHELDIPTSKKVDTKVSHKVEPGTNVALVILWVTFVVFAFFIPAALFLVYCFCKNSRVYEPLLSRTI